MGISTKYGRKVLGRLEKVQAVRDELYAAKFEQPANMGRLRKALDDAAAYSTLIDASLLGSIQVRLILDLVWCDGCQTHSHQQIATNSLKLSLTWLSCCSLVSFHVEVLQDNASHCLSA